MEHDEHCVDTKYCASRPQGLIFYHGYSQTHAFAELLAKMSLEYVFLFSSELVKADGEVIIVNKKNHPQLFWAMKGYGANFGYYKHSIPILILFDYHLSELNRKICSYL